MPIDDLSADVNASLAQWSAKLKQSVAAQTAAGTNTSPLSPAEPGQPVQAVTVQPIQPAPAAPPAPLPTSVTSPPATPPVEPPKAQEPAPAEPPATEPAIQAEPWDKDLFTGPVKDEPLTLETLGSALKLTKAPKTTNELVEHFTAQEARIKELETSSKTNELLGLDDDLVEVVKAAKSGADWKEYMGTRVINYNQADPELLFDRSVQMDPRFKRPDGSVDQDAIDAELAAIPLAIKRSMGSQIKQQLVYGQEQRRLDIIHAAERRQADFARNLAVSVQKVPQFMTKETFGIALEPQHVDYLYNGIKSGELVQKHLGAKFDIATADPEKLAKTIALAEFGERAAKVVRSQGIVQGKKDLLKGSQNVNLNTTASLSPPDPTIQGAKPLTAAEKLAKIYNKPQGTVPTL